MLASPMRRRAIRIFDETLRDGEQQAGLCLAVEDKRELAARIGRPSAVRAVGTAVGQNPIAYLIPCHRVIRRTGAIGEYRWGPQRKQAMLALEGA